MAEKLDLEAIEAREKAATAGPWRWGCWSTRFGTLEPVRLTHRRTLEHCPELSQLEAGIRNSIHDPEPVLQLEEDIEEADALFIMHARTDIPVLTREVRRLREENKRLHNELASHLGG